jgi:aryl-alcohol dehydrogenase-like predicted oxidoreductase
MVRFLLSSSTARPHSSHLHFAHRVLKNPVITAPIIGISNARALDDALKAVHVKLSDEDVKEIEDAYSVRPNQGFS